MSINFVRPGWFKFYEDGKIKTLYGRKWSSNEEIVKILYFPDEIKTVSREDIISEEEDIYARDYSLR